jgi:hypothetical protein
LPNEKCAANSPRRNPADSLEFSPDATPMTYEH